MKKELTPLDDVVFSHPEIEKNEAYQRRIHWELSNSLCYRRDVKDDGTAAEDDIHDD